MTYVCRFIAVSLVFAATTLVEARNFRVDQIPNGNVNRCLNCHTASGGGGPRNAFGLAVEGFLSTPGRSGNVQWNAALAGLDSDGDGFTNGQELGDPNGTGTPTAGAQVTNPGDPGSRPVIPNRAPVFGAIEVPTGREGEPLTFSVQATDEDKDAITYRATGLPSGASFAGSAFSWTPDFDQAGTYDVTFTAGDGEVEASLTVTVTVEHVNRAPVFDPIDIPTGKEGEPFAFSLQATDQEGDPITYGAKDLPTGAELAGSAFSWTPGFDQAGTYDVTFTAGDGADGAELTVTLTVENVNAPASLSGFSPNRALVVAVPGDTLRFSVTAVDPDGDPITYAWTVNDEPQAEPGASLLLTVPDGGEDRVTVSISSGGDLVTRTWSVGKTLRGDFNDDRQVNFADFLAFVPTFGKGPSDPEFDPKFDLNGSDRIDFGDFLEFVRYFGLKAP